METRVSKLSEASPDGFTKGGRDTETASLQFSPLQVVLIAYSVVSDDNLLDSVANRRKYMKAVQDWHTRKFGHYQDPEPYKPYGVNGYDHSSPVDLFLDEASVDRLLTLMEQRRRA